MNDANRKALAGELKLAEAWLEAEGFRPSNITMRSHDDDDDSSYQYVGEMWVTQGQGAVIHTLELSNPRRIFSVDVLLGRGGKRGDRPWMKATADRTDETAE